MLEKTVPRILIVEDEPLVSILIEDVLAEIGWDFVGPARSVSEALALAEVEALSAAVLDVNLDGMPVDPVSEALERRGIPYLLMTGYQRAELPLSLRHAPVLEKPFEPMTLLDAVRSLIGAEVHG